MMRQSRDAVPPLYTAQILALATEVAQFPLAPCNDLRGDARSRTCGSTLALGMSLDEDGMIDQIGLQVVACAIGQASAAIFAHGARGRSPADILGLADAVEQWLTSTGEMPDWPNLIALAPARERAGRHGAIMLPWNAARMTLSSETLPG